MIGNQPQIFTVSPVFNFPATVVAPAMRGVNIAGQSGGSSNDGGDKGRKVGDLKLEILHDNKELQLLADRSGGERERER